jgi:OmpA-OmpF porin, OOP family
MNRFLFFLLLFTQTAFSQAFYYFDKGFAEFTGKYPDLEVEGQKGDFAMEVVSKFGKEPRPVYRNPTSSGLMFDNSKIKNFLKGSYSVEMYFRYDNGDMLVYGQLMGDQLTRKKGQYVHLVISRDQKTEKVNIFLEGKPQYSFIDSTKNLEIDDSVQISFFTDKGKETTSGAVAMIKIYNYFIDEKAAENLFYVFSETKEIEKELKDGQIKNLFFVQSQPIILPESIPELENINEFLVKNPNIEIEIQGHTDNQGEYDLNLKLSKDRATAVKKYLIDKGINQKRIATRGFGSLNPVASNATEESRRKNRRVEIKILKE